MYAHFICRSDTYWRQKDWNSYKSIYQMYADKGGSKFIFTDRGGEFSSEVMYYIAEQLGFTKVYTSPYSPKSNSVIETCHSCLKNSIRKMRYNRDAEWVNWFTWLKWLTIYSPIQLQGRVHSSSCMEETAIYQPCTDSYNPGWDTWESKNVECISVLWEKSTWWQYWI